MVTPEAAIIACDSKKSSEIKRIPARGERRRRV